MISTPLAALAQALDAALRSVRARLEPLGVSPPHPYRPVAAYPCASCGGAHSWVDSFWSGQLWLAYAHTGAEEFRAAAQALLPYFARRIACPHDHDLGFLYSLSAVASYRLTGDVAARELGLRAAELLARRFRPAGGFILAWNDWPDAPEEVQRRVRGRMIIDTLQNLALLFWAAQQSGREELRQVALAHADTARRYLVRPDGSSYHAYDFDPQTGRPLGGVTVQGYADESCWSRGQAWGIHGFAQTYRYTGEARFLTAARSLADYALARLPDDGVPFWDYSLPPGELPYRDSSAAAIMAAGLLLICEGLGEQAGADRERYRAAAERVLGALASGYRSAADDQPLLLQGAGFVRHGDYEMALPYGDYYYVEALMRALGRHDFFW
jgi:unsaturated chondroitin disaccharide hydrolase